MELQARVESCCERWGLRLGDRLRGGFSADVFACRDERGRERVLKLLPTAYEANTEAAALRAWGGNGAVGLVDYSHDLAALLLLRLVPGTPLPAGDDDRAVAAVAEVLAALHAVDVSTVDVPVMPLAFDHYLAHTIAHAEPDTAGLALLDGFFSAGRVPCTDIVGRAERLADALRLDAHRAARWAAIWAVGEACET